MMKRTRTTRLDGQITSAAPWTQTASMLEHRFESDRFLNDYPHYTRDFRRHKLSSIFGNFEVLSSEARARSNKFFDVAISFHKPGDIFKDLHSLGRPCIHSLESHSVDGYMSSMAKGSGKFYICLNARARKKVCFVATLIHELGHYVDERARFDRKTLC